MNDRRKDMNYSSRNTDTGYTPYWVRALKEYLAKGEDRYRRMRAHYEQRMYAQRH